MASRLTSGTVQLRSHPPALAEVARPVVDSFLAAGRCSELKVDARLASVTVYGDETRLEQVVSNLLDNACKYTPSGGRIEVTVTSEGANAVLSVADSGCGIGADLLPHMFDPFTQGNRTLDRSQGGLGLGLTVVRRLVELHGGSVSAASEGADCGAMFSVCLPVMDAKAQAPVALTLELPTLDMAVVEDNADNREFVAEVLRLRGHRVIVADDGMRGVDAIVEGNVDVALVDIGLPGWDGYEVARRVRAVPAGRSVLLIALTGYGREEDRAQATAGGFDAFLVKRFDVARFESAVATSTRTALRRVAPQTPRVAGGGR